EKHNDLNGEGNRDGDNNNFSDNYGVEGPTPRPEIDDVRMRQIRNMLATLLISQGVPMILSGDECRRTQGGNNNAYCQDNDISWFDWSLVEAHADLVRFVRELIRFRLDNPTLRRRVFLEGGRSADGALPDVEWFSPEGTHVDWYAADASLACFFGAPSEVKLHDVADLAAGGVEGTPRHVLVFAHAGSLPRTFCFPQSPLISALPWRLFVHTGRQPPQDIHPDGSGPAIDTSEQLELPERSLVCLVADVAPA
ncbi:MAG: glycogen debranching enzyme, partial [Planctomycetia bacterium]